MKLFCLILPLLLFKGCVMPPKPTPPPADVPSAGALAGAGSAQESKVSASVAAARKANESNPAGVAKDAVEKELSVAAANLHPATAADADEAFGRVKLALAGDAARANLAWAGAVQNGLELMQKVNDLQAKVDQEKAKAAADLAQLRKDYEQQVKDAHDEERRKADQKLNLILQLLTFGGGALSLVGAGVVTVLAGSIPILGPNIARALGLAGATLFSLGLLIRSVDRFVDSHPYIFWGGLVLVGLCAVAAAALAYSNHHHETPAK